MEPTHSLNPGDEVLFRGSWRRLVWRQPLAGTGQVVLDFGEVRMLTTERTRVHARRLETEVIAAVVPVTAESMGAR